MCVGGSLKPRPSKRAVFNTAARWNIVRARSKRPKQDSLPQDTGRANKSSRYIILLKVKRVCRSVAAIYRERRYIAIKCLYRERRYIAINL